MSIYRGETEAAGWGGAVHMGLGGVCVCLTVMSQDASAWAPQALTLGSSAFSGRRCEILEAGDAR